ncbi:MAG: hypothetical protein ACRDQ6_00430 [Pseudonocardiaceae bacterium]
MTDEEIRQLERDVVDTAVEIAILNERSHVAHEVSRVTLPLCVEQDARDLAAAQDTQGSAQEHELAATNDPAATAPVSVQQPNYYRNDGSFDQVAYWTGQARSDDPVTVAAAQRALTSIRIGRESAAADQLTSTDTAHDAQDSSQEDERATAGDPAARLDPSPQTNAAGDPVEAKTRQWLADEAAKTQQWLAENLPQHPEQRTDNQGTEQLDIDRDPDPAGWVSAMAVPVPDWVTARGPGAVADYRTETADHGYTPTLDPRTAGERDADARFVQQVSAPVGSDEPLGEPSPHPRPEVSAGTLMAQDAAIAASQAVWDDWDDHDRRPLEEVVADARAAVQELANQRPAHEPATAYEQPTAEATADAIVLGDE